MKTACKVFIIIGMVFGFLYIIPLVVGAIALNKLANARRKEELTGVAICTLLLCSTIGGILMLCLNEKDLVQNSNQNVQSVQNVANDTDREEKAAQDEISEISKNIEKLKELKAQGVLSDEEYERLRKTQVDKLLRG